jgi:hypothetical protein
MKDWDEKWFPKEGIKEDLPPKIQNSLPEFCGNVAHVIREESR